MPDFPMMGGAARYEAVAPYKVDCTSPASANDKGGYTELIASTAAHASGIFVNLVNNEEADFLTDIAVGAASSEQDIFSNLGAGSKKQMQNFIYHFPVAIPAGTRLSARTQNSDATAEKCGVQVKLYSNPFPNSSSLGRVTTYGANEGDSGGVSVDPGADIDVKGAYSEIVASTANETKLLLMYLGTQTNFSRSSGAFSFDVAIGAATSEQIIIPDIHARTSSGLDQPHLSVYGPFPINIPSGSRIAVRSQSTLNDAADRLLDVILYGVD